MASRSRHRPLDGPVGTEKWRLSLIARGWIEGKERPPPTDQWIEYHVYDGGTIYSGRCRLDTFDIEGERWSLGHPVYLCLSEWGHKIPLWRLSEHIPADGKPWGPRAYHIQRGHSVSLGTA